MLIHPDPEMITGALTGADDAADAHEAHETQANRDPRHAYHNAETLTGNDYLFFGTPKVVLTDDKTSRTE